VARCASAVGKSPVAPCASAVGKSPAAPCASAVGKSPAAPCASAVGKASEALSYRSWEGWQVKRAERASRAPASSLLTPLKICESYDVAASPLPAGAREVRSAHFTCHPSQLRLPRGGYPNTKRECDELTLLSGASRGRIAKLRCHTTNAVLI
jgi:hypothetical protein